MELAVHGPIHHGGGPFAQALEDFVSRDLRELGDPAWRRRLPGWAFAVVRRVVGERVTRTPWEAVEHVTSRVTLSKPAAELRTAPIRNPRPETAPSHTAPFLVSRFA